MRLLVSDPLFFLLGYWYGDAAVAWMERRTKTWGQLLRQIEQWFGKAAYPLDLRRPQQLHLPVRGGRGHAAAGHSSSVNVAGTIARLWLIRLVGKTFESPLDDLVGWIGDHRIPLLVASVALVVVSIALEARRGETEVGSLAHLDDELEETADELERRRAAAPGPDEGDEPPEEG